MDSYYFPVIDAETFVVDEVRTEANGATRRESLRDELLVFHCIRAGPLTRKIFVFAYAAVSSGERFQRVTIRRKVDRKTRNIKLRVEPAAQFLNFLLKEAKQNWSKEERRRKMKVLDDEFAEAMGFMRQKLGLGGAKPPSFTYRVTDDAAAATGDMELQKILRTKVTEGSLSEKQRYQLKRFLEEGYPLDAEAVMTAVRATQSREHISAISLKSIDGKQQVTIVNAEGQRLTILEHKFRDLLKHPDSDRLLHKYTWQDSKSREVDFVFSGEPEGIVVARLNTASCVLDVLRLDEASRTHYDRARFVLDLDYVCCLYIVLQRIRDDRERYDRLLEQSDASVGFESFNGVLSPEYL